MDARFLRSRAALRSAVLRLAAERPVDALTVSEVCREAGVTRDTFYRHGTSPVDVLAQALAAELEPIIATESAEAGGAVLGEPEFRSAERALLEHVAEHAAVYRAASTTTMVAPLRATLEQVLRAALAEYLRRVPAIVPAGVDPADHDALAVIAAYAASGTVGAIEAWLADPALNIDRGVRLILAASPEFWLRGPATAS